MEIKTVEAEILFSINGRFKKGLVFSICLWNLNAVIQNLIHFTVISYRLQINNANRNINSV